MMTKVILMVLTLALGMRPRDEALRDSSTSSMTSLPGMCGLESTIFLQFRYSSSTFLKIKGQTQSQNDFFKTMFLPKNERTNLVFFAVKSKKAKKLIHLFVFRENLRRANLRTVLSDL